MFRTDYNTNEKCLRAVFTNRYGEDFECPKCQAKGNWYLIESRKRFDCSCGYGVYPLAGTIFHKSETPLKDWFYAIYLFASSRNGVAAKELERQLGVTYKTAHRIHSLLLDAYSRGTVYFKYEKKRKLHQRREAPQVQTRAIRNPFVYLLAKNETAVS